MNTIIKSTIILTLVSVFFFGSVGLTFAGHNIVIPEGTKVYVNEPDAAVLDDFGAAGTTFPAGDSMASEKIRLDPGPGSSSWY